MKVFNSDDYNRMCSEFLGYKILPDTDNQCFEHENHPWEVFHISDFKFNEDWNHIMDVVEKIKLYYNNQTHADVFHSLKTANKEKVIESIWEFLIYYMEEKFGRFKK